jgi:hypothetical protein
MGWRAPPAPGRIYRVRLQQRVGDGPHLGDHLECVITVEITDGRIRTFTRNPDKLAAASVQVGDGC